MFVFLASLACVLVCLVLLQVGHEKDYILPILSKPFKISNPVPDLWRFSELFRSPTEIRSLDSFYIADEMKAHVLECFKTGFVSHFEYPLPEPWGHVVNYEPLKSDTGKEILRRAMRKQVLQGKMIGGPG